MSRLQTKLQKIAGNPKVSAKSVGLRYASNNGKGYFRIGNNDNFSYRDHEGNSIKDETIVERIRTLVIPPAWQDVWISPYENGHLQCTGVDGKGRKQYRYHSNWNKIRNQSKFYRLRKFALALPAIREHVDKDLRLHGLPYEKVVALVIRLIEMTNIRIGNDAYKRLYGSFGLTTLRDRHVKFGTDKVEFEFVGKKGVKHKINLKSKRLAGLVKKCKEVPGQDLFQYYDDNGNHRVVGSGDINHYLKEITGEDFTAKDFRAWAGSVNALCGFHEVGHFENSTDCKKKIVTVLDSVAEKLGNTRTVCKKYYVHPTVIAAYETGKISKYKPDIKSKKLTPDEAALVKLLNTENIAEVLA